MLCSGGGGMAQEIMDYIERVRRVQNIRYIELGWTLIYTAIALLALGLSLMVAKYRPDCSWYFAFPIVYGANAIWRWFVWSSV